MTYKQLIEVMKNLVREMSSESQCACLAPQSFRHLFFNYTELATPNLGASPRSEYFYSSAWENAFSNDENKQYARTPAVTMLLLNRYVSPGNFARSRQTRVTSEVSIGVIDVYREDCANQSRCDGREKVQVMLDTQHVLVSFLSALNDVAQFRLNDQTVFFRKSKYDALLAQFPDDEVLNAMEFVDMLCAMRLDEITMPVWESSAGNFIGSIAINVKFITEECEYEPCGPSDVLPDIPTPEEPDTPKFETVIAGEPLSAGRVVIIDDGKAYHFQPSVPAHAGRFFGVTLMSALTGDTVQVQTQGIVSLSAYNFTQDSGLYVGNNGTLQHNFNILGNLQKAGVAIAQNSFLIQPVIQVQTL
jgi:hypothetical protein